MTSPFKSGFVSILGRPNAGKSTLLNALVGQKVAITADKPQTTRTAIQGVVTLPDAQIVFIDTPGIHKAETPINRRMMEAVRASVDHRDLLLFLVDPNLKPNDGDRHAIDLVKKAATPALLVITKIDLLADKALMLPVIERFNQMHAWEACIPVSATRRDGLDVLQKEVVARLPEGPQYFPEDYVTDQPERFLAAELIREKILRLTREEVPHSVAVIVDAWEEEQGVTRIYATVRVERDGQKGIIIGAKGAMLKRIGTEAREEMESLLDRRIYLDLRVRVEPGWREKAVFLDTIDWRTMAPRAEIDDESDT